MTAPRKHLISKGFDIRIAGQAAPDTHFNSVDPDRVGATLGTIPGVHLRPLVRIGDRVRRGDPVLAYRDGVGIVVVAPASGEVVKIQRDASASACVEIARDDSTTAPSRELRLPGSIEVATIDREMLADQLRESGLWPLLRERPMGGTPLSGPPQAVFINAMDTEPLAADPAVLLQGREKDFKQGLAIVGRLCDGPVYLSVSAATKSQAVFDDLRDVETHLFEGPHPAGLPGTHINCIAPLRDGARYWTIRAQDVARIGECARTRAFPSHRVVALAGPNVDKPGYYRVHEGSPLRSLVGEAAGDRRILQGTVLSAFSASIDDYLATTVHTLTVIGDGQGQRKLFGWALPQFNHPSASRASFGWLRRRSAYPIDARLHGEARAIVNIGMWDKVMPLDIHVSSLVRAIQAGDLEEALTLGLLDLSEEDVALCSYVDPCKLDVGAVIRQGLDQYASEQGNE